MKEFSWKIRVYYEDTDAAGLVYHSNYLKFMERARTEWLREAGFSQQRMKQETGAIIVISSVDMKFLIPARLDDELEVKSKLVSMGAVSFLCDQQIERNKDLICAARVKGACLNAHTFKPQRIPAALKSELNYDD